MVYYYETFYFDKNLGGILSKRLNLWLIGSFLQNCSKYSTKHIYPQAKYSNICYKNFLPKSAENDKAQLFTLIPCKEFRKDCKIVPSIKILTYYKFTIIR